MSNKPPKKSDLGKRWMKERGHKGIQMRPEYHLIVTEGTKTIFQKRGSILQMNYVKIFQMKK